MKQISHRHSESVGKLQTADQIPHPNVQCVSDNLQRSQRHALPPGLNPVEMDAVQPGQLRELVLRDAFSPANRLDPYADNFLNVLQRSSLGRMLLSRHPA